ncbi:MAG: urease accessory protein UreE [Synechococcus sp.]
MSEFSTTITALPQEEANEGRPTEAVWLDWHERRKARQRVTSDAGTELFLALPRGTVLADGQCLYREADRQIIVKARSQPLLKIHPQSPVESCRIAHHLGNWHRPIQIDPDGVIWVECDRPIADWLQRTGISFETLESPFHPNSIAHQH